MLLPLNISISIYVLKPMLTSIQKVNTVKSVEISMRVLHDKLTDNCHVVEVKEVWEVIEYCNFRLLDKGLFEDYFVKILEE
jgi:hypothetical protein